VAGETAGARADANLPLLRGTLDLLILKTLSWGPMHGFGIASWLETRSGRALGVDDSALYQSLHRLEGRGLVEAEWGVTENKRTARYYRLTRAGRQHLKREASIWLRYTRTVGAILAAETA
jgi:PadR family transcriptional regulator, regulatory protein PadR